MTTESKTYVLTQDTPGILTEISGRAGVDKERIETISARYFEQIQKSLTICFQESGVEIKPFYEADINDLLDRSVLKEMEANPNLFCVCLDRFLLKRIENQFPERFSRIGVTRTNAGEKAARQGTPPLEQQFEVTSKKIGDASIMIVDDGLFTGGTIEFTIDSLRKNGANGRVAKVVGFIGDSNLSSIRDIPVEVVSPIASLYEWIDIRDFSILGGKKLASSKSNGVSTAVPYIYPWSDGGGASFDRLGCFFEISKDMIWSFSDLLSGLEQTQGRQLLVQDLVKSGFPIPTNLGKTISISLKTPITTYLERCITCIEEEEERKVAVFDMDGTLYQLDGKDNTFTGSTLEKRVLENARRFICVRENCTPDQSLRIVEEGLKDPVGLSAFCSRRYGITRADYFNFVWNIDPEGAIFNFEDAVRSVKALAETNTKLILLTGAGGLWQTEVVKFLGLENVFENIYTAEDYVDKQEIFEVLAQRYRPSNVISVGDQEKTDIEPARKVGLKTMKVKNPQDISNIFEALR